MRAVFKEILERGVSVNATRGGNLEVSGVVLEISDPRARLSATETRGKPFSCLGELCWYLAGSNSSSFIAYYIGRRHYKSVRGVVPDAYGPRLFNWNGLNQIANVSKLLGSKLQSRRAVIQLFDPHDLLSANADVPCTCTIQFLCRAGRLNMIVQMRSNDAYIGLPHDIFCFTMLQEMLANYLAVALGSYTHIANSLHLYDKDIEKAKQFLGEGWQSTEGMPPMPAGDPWPSVRQVLSAEEQIRTGAPLDESCFNVLDSYWLDLIRLLRVFKCRKSKDRAGIVKLRREMSSRAYFPFVDKAIASVT